MVRDPAIGAAPCYALRALPCYALRALRALPCGPGGSQARGQREGSTAQRPFSEQGVVVVRCDAMPCDAAPAQATKSDVCSRTHVTHCTKARRDLATRKEMGLYCMEASRATASWGDDHRVVCRLPHDSLLDGPEPCAMQQLAALRCNTRGPCATRAISRFGSLLRRSAVKNSIQSRWPVARRTAWLSRPR